MNCIEARELLDAYIDDDISAEDLRALTDHAQACDECMSELKAAELMREAFADMSDEEDVPLEAQAAWRRAVRNEAKKKQTRRVLRFVCAAAAALVLLVGGSRVYLEKHFVSANMVVERDGSNETQLPSVAEETVSVMKKISTPDAEDAYASLEMLAAEYSGNCEKQGANGCRIELPYEYLEEFMSASGRIGTEISVEIYDEQAETAVIVIQFCAE